MGDFIELYNPTTNNVALGIAWYLSDDKDQLKKWPISDMQIPAGGFASFNNNAGQSATTNTFGLEKTGGRVYLSCFPANWPGAIVDAVQYSGVDSNRTYGRYPDGGSYWQSMPSNSCQIQ